MSNDLIERKEVISVLKEVFKKYNIGFKNGQGGFADAVPSAIEAIPTVYDVDKVVERLEDMRLKREEQLRACADNDIADYFRCKMSAIAETIEIVKSGSIE